MKESRFSIILPIYNQEKHLTKIFDLYPKKLNSLKDPWELILVVNGSKDKSFQVAKHLAKDYSNVLVLEIKQGGWGRAVKFGLEKAKGTILCYTNSARTDVNDLLKIMKISKKNNGTLIKASRVVRERLIRKVGSVLYNLEARLVLGTAVWDVNGTPKAMSREVYEKIKPVSNDDLIDAEIVAKAVKNKIGILEVPVILTNRISGKSTTNVKSALRMYSGLLRVREMLK